MINKKTFLIVLLGFVVSTNPGAREKNVVSERFVTCKCQTD